MLLIPSVVEAREPPQATDASDPEVVIEQILELREQLEALLSALPPELREEVERRWQERREASERETPIPPDLSSPSPDVAESVEERDESPETVSEPAVEVVTESVVETLEPASPSEPECVHLAAFDTNGDGVVSAADKYWRYLRLWTDNGDGVVDEDLEIESLFELDIREIRVELDYYSQPEDVTGDIELQDAVTLLLDDSRGRTPKAATLVVQADRMSRGGEIWLADPSGRVLTGYQPIGPSAFTETEEGTRQPLLCPQRVR